MTPKIQKQLNNPLSFWCKKSDYTVVFEFHCSITFSFSGCDTLDIGVKYMQNMDQKGHDMDSAGN